MDKPHLKTFHHAFLNSHQIHWSTTTNPHHHWNYYQNNSKINQMTSLHMPYTINIKCSHINVRKISQNSFLNKKKRPNQHCINQLCINLIQEKITIAKTNQNYVLHQKLKRLCAMLMFSWQNKRTFQSMNHSHQWIKK